MIRSISDSFMVPQNPRILEPSRRRSISSASFLNKQRRSSVKSIDDKGQSSDIVIDDEEEQLVRSKTELWIIIGLAVVYFIANSAFSIIAPFFPLEASKKGMNPTIQGLVFAIYPLVVFLASPLVGKYIPIIGTKFSLLAGSFIQGGCLAIFGCLDYVEGNEVFTIYCFVLRTIMALGAAASETACLCIISITFSHRLSTAQGIMSGSAGAGMMAGPAIGGILYKIGGFKLPLMAIGGVVVFVTFINFFIVPPESSFREIAEDNETVGFKTTFCIPGIAVMSTVSLTAGMVISFLDPTLTNYVELLCDNGLSSDMVGLIFLCTPLTYTIFTPFLGYLIDTKVRGRYVIIIGAFLGTACYLLMGPCPLFWNWLKPNIWLLIVSLLALGALSITSMFVPVLNDMQETARRAGLPMNLGTSSILSGIYTANFNLGSMLGPTLGGLLTDHLKFPWASSVFAGFLFIEGMLLLVFTICENIYYRKTSSDIESEPKFMTNDEIAPDKCKKTRIQIPSESDLIRNNDQYGRVSSSQHGRRSNGQTSKDNLRRGTFCESPEEHDNSDTANLIKDDSLS